MLYLEISNEIRKISSSMKVANQIAGNIAYQQFGLLSRNFTRLQIKIILTYFKNSFSVM